MKNDSPQPPRPTQAQIDKAYAEGLFACEIESHCWRGGIASRRADEIPDRRVVWVEGEGDTATPALCGWDTFAGDIGFCNDVMIFPWGRVPVAEWHGWPSPWWQYVSGLYSSAQEPSNYSTVEQIDSADPDFFRDSAFPVWHPSTEKRLLDAGFWTCERCISDPDEAPFAVAAWADPAAYAIYADWMDEHGCSLTARALRRVAELTTGAQV